MVCQFFLSRSVEDGETPLVREQNSGDIFERLRGENQPARSRAIVDQQPIISDVN